MTAPFKPLLHNMVNSDPLADDHERIFGLGTIFSPLASSTAAIKSLTPTNHVPYQVEAHDGTFVYAVGSINSDFLVRWPVSDPSDVTNLVTDIDSLTGITDGEFDSLHITGADTKLMIVREINAGANTAFMFRSTDGTSWGSFVMRPGWNGSVHRPSRSALGASSYENVILDDGSPAILFLEYKTVNTDELYGWISTDDGVTWSVWWTINAGATQHSRHGHSVYQDPTTKKIVACLGDSNTESAVIVGPNNGDWSAIDDTAIASISDPDFAVGTGAQRYRLIDLVFKDDFIYGHADAGADNLDRGIWKFNIDLSTYERVYEPSYLVDDDVIGGSGLLTSSGVMIFADLQQPASTGDFIKVHASADGTNFSTIGIVHMCAGHGSTRWFSSSFQAPNGDIYLGGLANIDTAGKGGRSCTIFREGSAYSAIKGEETLAPVYWVKPTGTDSAQAGWSSSGWATIKYALEGDRITNGARVRIDGDFVETAAAFPDWDGNAQAANTARETVLELVGNSTWRLDSSSPDEYNVRAIRDEEMPIRVLGGSIFSEKEGTFDLRDMTTKSKALTLEDLTIGDGVTGAHKGVIRTFGAGCVVELKRVIVNLAPSGAFGTLRMNHGGTLRVQSSVLIADGDARIIDIAVAATTLELENSLLRGYTNSAIRLQAAANVEPVIRSNEFDEDSSNDQIENLSALTLTGMDHNVSAGGTNVGSNSLPIGTDTKRNADFSLQSDSPCIGAGQAGTYPYDLNGILFLSPPSIGPTEGGSA